MYRSKYDGGLGIIDLETRIKAIHVMRLKQWLTGARTPRWANFAAALIAKDLTKEASKTSDPDLRWNPFTQLWRPPAGFDLTKHWLPELQAMMETARTLHIALDVFLPAQSLRRSLPVWVHIGLIPQRLRTCLNLRKAMKYENIQCLVTDHGIKTVGDLENAARSRNLPPDQTQHEPIESCNCDPCGTEREYCDDVIDCHENVQTIWQALVSSRWDPSLPDPPMHDHDEDASIASLGNPNENGDHDTITSPRTLLSGSSIAEAIKLFAPKRSEKITELAEEEAWYTNETRRFRDDCLGPQDDLQELTAAIAASAHISQDDEKARYGALVHPNGNECFNIPEEFDVRLGANTQEDDPIRPLLLAAIAAINKTPPEAALNVRTSNPKFVDILTFRKRALEGTDLLDIPSADAWRTLYAKINKRSGTTGVTLTSSPSPQTPILLALAKNDRPEEDESLVGDPLVAK